MANENDNLDASFGIQDTMEIGGGSSELLNDLLSPDTATSDPDDIKDIKDVDPVKPTKPVKPSKPATAEDEDDEEGDDTSDTSLGDFLSNFGEDDEEDDDDDDDSFGAAKKPVKPLSKKAALSEEDTEDEEGEGDDTDTPEGTQFEALTNDLINLGVFSSPEEGEEADPITTPEAFLEKFNSEKKKGAIEMVDNFIGQFGAEYQDAFDAIFVKGMNPKEYFTQANTIMSFSDLDLSKESNQEKVVRQALADQGFESEDIDSEVERLRDYGDLESTSQRHHKVLIKKEKAALAQKTLEAQREQQQKVILKQTYAQNVSKVLGENLKKRELDGLPLTPKMANELQDFLLTDKWKTASGETLTDFDRYMLDLKRPENHAKKVKVALLLNLLEKDPTLSTIQKKGITTQSNEMFKEVSRQVTRSKKAPATPKSWFK